MKFYKIQMLGRFLSEYVADVSALVYSSSLDKGRIVYDETTNTLYFGDDGSNQFSQIGGAAPSPSIPSSEIILFEKNTAVSGYSLLTDVDDETVFISKGAGSVIGPGATTVGTWTQPGHTHTGPSHTHGLGSHTHTGTTGKEQNMNASQSSSGSFFQIYQHDHAFTTDAASGNTGSDGTGATSSSATANTWRPAGRIFTRQQKI